MDENEAEELRRWEEKRAESDAIYVASGMAKIDQMSGVEFEHYVAARLRENGWQVDMTAATGDYGVDLIARNGGECMAIQCKRHGKPVGVWAVQQVVAGAGHYGCTRSMVVSNQEFTQAAAQLARSHSCRLIGRDLLLGRWGSPSS